MFETLPEQPADKILQLMQMFRDDPRERKIDLGVGVYKNAEGVTPIMRAVKTAEKRIWDTETSKSYTGLPGTPEYNDAMVKLVLGDAVPRDTVASAATPGGTGAVHHGFMLARKASPGLTVWYSDPTWPNHVAILNHLGIPSRAYRYFDRDSGTVDVAGMLEDLGSAAAGDVVLLHGCCHNPTGANLTMEDWQQVIAVIRDRGLLPMIDIAYQGFGDGLDADAAPTRAVVSACPEAIVAASCSKNFGVYKERAGIVMAVDRDASRRAVTQGNLNALNRLTYSFAPDHGARLVSTVLSDEALRADWQAELEDVREGMLGLRQALADALRQETNSDRFDFLARHRGMFSMLGLSPDEVKSLREDHGIYIIGDSRMNIAGLNSETVPILAKAVAEVIR
ncbi:aminotransferase class I/II-fold pyridoxal phosphate-dependent enzyme [Rhodobacterales bacterium HKCCE2091]|nr:aminotransferase class I/II-fold pyridoxal phosphate-dependent enzyme [Rhodobacterales bacterium HKCCE2091]